MKIYTKTGDTGMTSLYDGSRLAKNYPIFDVLGEIDELSCRIGMLYCMYDQHNDAPYSEGGNSLRIIQHILQDINSHLATPDENKRLVLRALSAAWVSKLEHLIDDMEKTNPKLTVFILPGATPLDAQAHLCRTQTRKVERMLVQFLSCDENKERVSVILQFFNRLSDFFFVLARWFCNANNVVDVTVEPWKVSAWANDTSAMNYHI